MGYYSKRSAQGWLSKLLDEARRGELRQAASRASLGPNACCSSPSQDVRAPSTLADLPLHLTTIGEPVLRVPDIAARASTAEHVAGERVCVLSSHINARRLLISLAGHLLIRPQPPSRDKVGTKCMSSPDAFSTKNAVLQPLSSAGGGTRTPDTRIMIPLL